MRKADLVNQISEKTGIPKVDVLVTLAVVDGNVQRVIARYFGISTPIDTTAGKKLYHTIAQALLDSKKAGVYNQAIMDFGAVICKPQNPLCNECVQRTACEAYAHGLVKQLPVKEKAIQKKHRWFSYFIVELNDRVYIRLRTGKDIWENLHEFVLYESAGAPDLSASELPFLQGLMKGQQYQVKTISRIYRQQLTHQTISGQFVVINVGKPVPALKDYLLIDRIELSHYAFPRLINSFLGEKSFPAQLF